MCSWKLPYFNYNVEFPTLCLSDGSHMPNTWWISVFQLLNSNLGSLTFLYILFLHCLRYSRLCSPCSIVIYSEICGSYLAKLTTTLLGRGSLFPSMISFSHQSPYSLLSPTNVIFSPPLYFLSCNAVISHWYADMFQTEPLTRAPTEVWLLFYLIYTIVLYTHHSYSLEH